MQRQRSDNSDKTKRFWLHPAENMIPLLSNTVSVLQRAEKEENYAKYLNNRVYRCGLLRRGDSFAYRTATAWGCRVCRWMLGKRSQGVRAGGAEKRQCEIAAWKPQSVRSPLVFILSFIVPGSHGPFLFQKQFIAHRQAGSHPESTIDACLCPKLTACVAFDDTN